MPGRRASSIYASGLAMGLVVVSFPASAAVLKTAHGFTDAQYGGIFIPQTIFSILGSLISGGLAARWGLSRLLRLALAACVVAELLLLATTALGDSAAYAAVLGGTACMGLGFGLSSAPLNAFPGILFPARRDTALVALHTAIGTGFAIGPIVIGALAAAGAWAAFPAALGAAAALLTVAPHPDGTIATSAAPGGGPTRSRVLWLLLAIAMVYAIAEGTFANWAVVYLHEERGIAATTATLALSVFWGSLVGARLVISAIVLRVPAARVWLALPPLIAAAFLLIPLARDGALGVAVFGLAGAACGGFFPLTVGLATRRFPDHAGFVAAMLTAALMIGVGLGSFALGPLRDSLALADVYRVSAAGPVILFVLAALSLRAAPEAAVGRR